MTKVGSVIVACCFEAHFSAIPGNLLLVLRKCLEHSGTVLGQNRPFFFLFEKRSQKKHLERKYFEYPWKVSQFFAFFYDAFVIHLQCLEEII